MRYLTTLALLLALAVPAGAQVLDSAITRVPSLGGSGDGGAIAACAGDQGAFGVCLDTATGELVWEGATADAFEAKFAFTDPTVDAQLLFNTNGLTAQRTLTVPDASGTLATLENPNSWT